MKIKPYILLDFACVYIFTTISILLYYHFFKIENGTLFFAIIATAVRSLITVYTMNNIENTCKDNYYSGGAFLLYTTVLYNQVASIKYSVDYFYPGAINTLYTRALGSLYIDFVIMVANIFFKYYHKKKYENIEKKDSIIGIDFLYITLLFLFIYVYLNFSSVFKTGQLLIYSVSRTSRTFVNSLTYITYALTIMNIRLDSNKRVVVKSTIPCILLTVVNLLLTMITGKKNIIIVYMVVTICGLLMTRKIKFSIAKISAYISPLILQIIQIISERTSERDWFNTTYLLRYHAFRFDISDFAITIANRFSSITKPFNVIIEALEYSIPKVFNVNKISELIEYKTQIESVGLTRDFDFNDTFFSMGAQVGGYIGIMIVFIAILIFFEYFSYKIYKIKIIGGCINIVLISYFASCESDWSMFIFQTRDVFIYIILSYILFRVSLKIKNGGNQNDICNNSRL